MQKIKLMLNLPPSESRVNTVVGHKTLDDTIILSSPYADGIVFGFY